MLGATWERTLNGALDEISRLRTERDSAAAALDDLVVRRPDLLGDEHVTLARLALT